MADFEEQEIRDINTEVHNTTWCGKFKKNGKVVYRSLTQNMICGWRDGYGNKDACQGFVLFFSGF